MEINFFLDRLKNNSLHPKLTTQCKKIEKRVPDHFWKLLINFGDQLSWGPFVQGDQMSQDCLYVCAWGPIVLGTICPWGPNMPGLFGLGDQLWGTKYLGTECVQDQMRSTFF